MLTAKGFAKSLDIQPGTMSEVVTKLESRNLIIRTRDPKDRRKATLSITELGRKHVEEFEKDYSNNRATTFDVLSSLEKEQLENILKKILGQEKNN